MADIKEFKTKEQVVIDNQKQELLDYIAKAYDNTSQILVCAVYDVDTDDTTLISTVDMRGIGRMTVMGILRDAEAVLLSNVNQ